MLYKVFLHIAHTLLIFRFASLCIHLGGIYLLSALINNKLNLLYAYITFIHTTASLMNALCYVTPYLYYSALISLNLSLTFLCLLPNFKSLLISKHVYLLSYSIRIAQPQGNHGYFPST